LRGGAALAVAGLCADGVTEIENVCYINRGYENIASALGELGADIHIRADSDSMSART
jgi:UDP-N-acetylglucosamine 1-carboxyvinyltransferase